MRQTMGMLAIHLSNRIHEKATGLFKIEFEKAEGQVMQKHLSEQKLHPIIMEGGKLQSGYLNLCPITEQTHYWAYIIVD